MKKFLLSGAALAMLAVAATPALAADLARRPVYKAAPAPAPLFNWTGFYIGAHGGYAWGDFGGLNDDGGFGGGQIGVNWQTPSNWVWGLEADIAGSGQKDDFLGTNVKTDLFGTARVRLGYAVDRTLFYGTGGLAWANTKFNDGLVGDKQTNIGWTVGGGIEYAFAPNWTAKVEYLYADYGNDTYNVTVPTSVDLKTNTVKVGINYLFGTGGGRW